MTSSGGVASYPADAKDVKTLLNMADVALYQAKENGKNRIVLHNTDKRHYIRVDFAGDVQINKIDQEPSQVTAQGKNFSRSGLLLESPVPIDIGTRVKVKLAD